MGTENKELRTTSITKCYLIMLVFSGIMTFSIVLFGVPMIILSLLFVIFSFCDYIASINFSNKTERQKCLIWTLLWVTSLFHLIGHYYRDLYYDYDTSDKDLTKNNYKRSVDLIFDSLVHVIGGLLIHSLILIFQEYKLIFLRMNGTSMINTALVFHHIFYFCHAFGWYYFASTMSVYSIHYHFSLILGACAGIQMFTQLILFWNDRINLPLSPASRNECILFQLIHILIGIASSHSYLNNDPFSKNGALFSFFIFSLSPLKKVF